MQKNDQPTVCPRKINQPKMSPPTWQQRATLYGRQQEIFHGVAETLHEATGSQDFREYIIKRYNWDDDTADLVDWDIHEIAMNSLSSNEQQSTIKFLHQWLPLNGHPSQESHRRLTKCPCCLEAEETLQHYMTCDQLQEQWQIGITRIIATAT